jgi:hypothetical protein
MNREKIYIIEKNKAGKVLALYRFWEDEFSHEEIFIKGNWTQKNDLVGVLYNLHNPCYEEINEKTAKILMSQMILQAESQLQIA